MATNLGLDPEPLERAFRLSGERTQKAAVTRARQAFIARREQRRVVEPLAALACALRSPARCARVVAALACALRSPARCPTMDGMSWDEGFSERYDAWAAEVTADIPFYVGLAREADGPIVELAVGTGRVAIPVALATGRPVIGIDASPGMLRQARARAAEAGVGLTLVEGDMRDLALDEPAALIYCPFRALLHLRTWADRRRVFERVAASLRPGGRFAWNAFAFDHRVAMRHDGVRHEAPLPHTVRYAVGDNRIDLMLDGGGTSSLWWATKNEWLGLLDVAGLQLEALYGGFEREPLTDDSTEYVFVARR